MAQPITKRGSVFKTTVDGDSVVFTCLPTGDTLRVAMSSLDMAIQREAIAHGVKQKVNDAAALPSGASVAEKWAEMREVVERITGETPSWNAIPVGGTAGPRLGALLEAVCEFKRIAATDTEGVAKIRTWLSEKSNEQRAALRVDAKIKPLLDAIEARRAKPTAVDSDAMLAELE